MLVDTYCLQQRWISRLHPRGQQLGDQPRDDPASEHRGPGCRRLQRRNVTRLATPDPPRAVLLWMAHAALFASPRFK